MEQSDSQHKNIKTAHRVSKSTYPPSSGEYHAGAGQCS